ncbi:MAG: replication protein DnaC [Clostridia bacterium]|jgi:DNA replication protein DnaC|nr:replication protein DnaC [Clostridia bacterium]
MKEYADLRDKHKKELEHRKSVLYAKLPRLRDIEESLVKLSIDITKAILNNSQNRQELLEILHKKQMDLKAERVELLLENNYPRDYLELRYQCKNCKDTGYIDGKKCSCLVQREIEELYKQSNMSSSFKRENFDMFRFDLYSNEAENGKISPQENMKDIYRSCINYVKNFDSHDKNLFFIGKPGLGKTFLCNSIAKELLDAGRSVIYQSSPDLIDTIRKYKFDFDKEEENAPYLEELYHCDLLIIDDLGTELSTQFSNLAIYNILNRRLLNNKKIIISTNLNTDELMSTYSERIYSRILGSFSMYKFFGDDIRLKMRTM